MAARIEVAGGPNPKFGGIPTSLNPVVCRTREGIRRGQTLTEVKRSLKLKRGPYSSNSLNYANELLVNIGTAPRANLPEPFCVVFVKFKRWQLE